MHTFGKGRCRLAAQERSAEMPIRDADNHAQRSRKGVLVNTSLLRAVRRTLIGMVTVTGVVIGGSPVFLGGGPVARASVGAGDDWPQFHGSVSRTGVNPDETSISADNVDQCALNYIVQGPASIPGSPVVANGIVYFGSNDGKVQAVSADSGAS